MAEAKDASKVELNEALLSHLNGKLVDVSWKLYYTVSNKNMNKVYKPEFIVTLKVIVDGFGLKGRPFITYSNAKLIYHELSLVSS